MNQGKAGDRVGGLSKRLVVLFLAMVIAGFAIPSPGIAIGHGLGTTSHSQYHALAAPSDPLLLIVPSIRLRAPILPIQVDSHRVLTPPSDFHEVGWWDRSAKPGSLTGQTLLTGHTVHTGGGVMNELGNMRAGDLVQIKTKLGIVDYATTDVFVYTKAQLAQNADILFDPKHGTNRLVLVTCTGWTGHDYTSNIIVFAAPLGVRNTGASKSKVPLPPILTPARTPANPPTSIAD
ncbi:MAG: Sortase family protein [Marmoricola sp.]|nr:Sortase family protein [Marmoricola sp.]